MSTSAKTSYKPATPRRHFLARVNIRWPWLKLVAFGLTIFVILMDLSGATTSRGGDRSVAIRVAPMSRHVRVTERILAGKKLVALTFDDGPSANTTPRLLDVLHRKDVPATFFVLGTMARNNSDIVKRADREGHEVASHTMYHQNLPRISADSATSDINEAKGVLKEILGHDVNFTRPPYGNISNVVREVAGTPLILWSVDTLDWQNHNPAEILENTKNQVFDGAIILMHDIYDTSVDAVGTVIDELRKEGYEFATIPEIIKERNLKLENGSAYRSL